MKNLHTLVIGLFLIGLIVVTVVFNITKKRLLILQSYDKDYAWTRDVDTGLRRILGNEDEYVIRWFYMDTKRHPWEQYKINSGLAVQKLINNWHPAVVIAIDDDAQRFAMKYFNNHNDVQVVFSGVNNNAADYGYDTASNVTGILERLPLVALKETLLEITSHSTIKYPPRVMFLGDKSATVRGDEAFFSNFDWNPIQRVESHLVETYIEWKNAVRKAASVTDFIIVSNYRQILRQKGATDLVPPAELIAWTENNSHPSVIGTNVFFANDGGMLAIGTSPYEQGETAAKMAKDLLDNEGKSAKSIPIVISKEFVVSMRNSRIKAHHIKLSSVYVAAAKSANNYYEGAKDEEVPAPAPIDAVAVEVAPTTTVVTAVTTKPVAETNPVTATVPSTSAPVATTTAVVATKPVTVTTPSTSAPVATTTAVVASKPVTATTALVKEPSSVSVSKATKPATAVATPVPAIEPVATTPTSVTESKNPIGSKTKSIKNKGGKRTKKPRKRN